MLRVTDGMRNFAVPQPTEWEQRRRLDRSGLCRRAGEPRRDEHHARLQPSNDRTRDLVNVTSLYFGKELREIHGFGAKTFVTRASKRGSERSGSQVGFTL